MVRSAVLGEGGGVGALSAHSSRCMTIRHATLLWREECTHARRRAAAQLSCGGLVSGGCASGPWFAFRTAPSAHANPQKL